jgi:hypothetical protein
MLKDRQNRSNVAVMMSSFFVVVFVLFCLNACTAIHFNTIPAPPPTNKLRVFIMPVTGTPPTRVGWARSHEQFKKDQFRAISNYLKDTGIYEVVPEEEIHASLGTQDFAGWQWLNNDLALAKQAGKALHADYMILSIRNAVSGFDYESKIVCVNLESGKQYMNSFYVALSSFRSREEVLSWNRKMFHATYPKMFHDLKEDLLATAIRKGHLLPKEEIKKPALPDAKLALATPLAPQTASTPPPVPVEKKLFPVKSPAEPASPISRSPEEAKVFTSQLPAKEELKAPDTPQVLPISKHPAPEAKPAMPDESLKPTTPVEIPSTQTFSPKTRQEAMEKQAMPDIKKDTDIPKVMAKISPAAPPDLPSADKSRDDEIQLGKELQEVTPTPGKARLVVYDFNAAEHLNVVALILTEALREELFILGRFTLVNRENMIQVLEEFKLQQSGLVDEGQVVKLGKWFAANEAVSGQLAILGNSYVLQAKRIDISTMGTLGRGSIKCTAGHEEELLSGMPVLAKKLIAF